MKETCKELELLAEELVPSAEDVRAILDGSLEAQRDTPPTYHLLRELGVPTAEDVRVLQMSVVDALERDPPAQRERRRRTAVAMSTVAVVAGLAAGAFLVFG